MATPHCSSFEYDPATDICYRDLSFLGHVGYRVGDDGSVQSKNTTHGRCLGSWRNLSQTTFKHKSWDTPYKNISLRGDSKNLVTYRVHKLVLLAFVGPCPEGKQCCHGNGQHGDNRVSNLRWGTPAENCRDRFLHGCDIRGEGSPTAKLSEADVREIRRAVKSGVMQITLAKKYGVTAPAIHRIVIRKSWKHIN